MTNKVKLIRFKHGYKSIIGKVYINNKFFCYSLELEDLNNQRSISCIPTGIYQTTKHNGKNYQNVSRLRNVANRSAILIHHGNYRWNIMGCILLGNSYETQIEAYNRKTKQNELSGMVKNSKATIKSFYEKIGYEFEIEITSELPTQTATNIKNTNLNNNINNNQIKNKMPILESITAISVIGKVAPSIVNYFKRKGKKITEKTARKLITKIEDKTGLDLCDDNNIKKARNKLSEEDLMELQMEIIKSDNSMMKAEFKHGEDLSKTWKDEFITIAPWMVVFYTLIMVTIDPETSLNVIEALTNLTKGYFGLILLVISLSAAGMRSAVISYLSRKK